MTTPTIYPELFTTQHPWLESAVDAEKVTLLKEPLAQATGVVIDHMRAAYSEDILEDEITVMAVGGPLVNNAHERVIFIAHHPNINKSQGQLGSFELIGRQYHTVVEPFGELIIFGGNIQTNAQWRYWQLRTHTAGVHLHGWEVEWKEENLPTDPAKIACTLIKPSWLQCAPNTSSLISGLEAEELPNLAADLLNIMMIPVMLHEKKYSPTVNEQVGLIAGHSEELGPIAVALNDARLYILPDPATMSRIRSNLMRIVEDMAGVMEGD